MGTTELDQLFREFAEPVINRLQSFEFLSTFQDCSQFLAGRILKIPAWQIALPVISCLAAGGTLEEGTALASAWVPGLLASEILDNVEDKQFVPDQLAPSPEVATNLATSFIFISFYALSLIQDSEKASHAARIFSRSGFDAAYGQHRDLIKTPSSVEGALNDYWEMIILKSGSVFRTATAGGAAAGTSDGRLIDSLGEYGTALGVLLQLIDDCRDVFNRSQEMIDWEISLPLLLYLLASGEENICFPKISSRAELSDLLGRTGIINAISSLLLEWKDRALDSLQPLPTSREKHILEGIPALFLERIHLNSEEVQDGNSC
jgi:hypothetical protein